MKLSEARLRVSGRLKFADTGQIAAVATLDRYETLKAACLREKARLCPACEGLGYVIACGCGRDCDVIPPDPVQCPMPWLEACGLCEESGILDSDSEPIKQIVEADEDAREDLIDWLKSKTAGTRHA